MKKLIFIIFVIMLFCVGCSDGDKANLIFNASPIDERSVLYSSNNFAAGQKVYYLFYTPKKVKAEFIRVQIFKAGDTVSRGGYSIYMTNDYRVMLQNLYYYYDNFTVYQPGRYVMQIFDLEDLSKPLVYNEFFIK